MLRTLLTTTAIVAVIQTGAFAADETAKDPMTPNPVFEENAKYERRVTDEGYFEASHDQILANTLIGKSVYSGTSDDAERIGEINDILISANGAAEAVLIGIGGFLGIGEKDVAVDFDRVTWVDRDGDRWIVVEATKDQLENAPAYDVVAMTNEADSELVDEDKVQAEAEQTDEMNSAEMTEEQTEEQKTAEMTDEERTEETAAAKSDDSKMETVDLSSISAEELIGARVYGETQEDMGEITDVILTDSGEVEAFVVDVGGFLGINEKQIAIGAENIDFRKDEDGDLVVFTPFTQGQLEKQASYSESDYEQDKENGSLKAPRS